MYPVKVTYDSHNPHKSTIVVESKVVGDYFSIDSFLFPEPV